MAKANTTEGDPRDAKIAELQAQMATMQQAMAALVANQQSPRERFAAETRKRLSDIERGIAESELNLFDGPRKFRCSLPKEPMMTHVVGAPDAMHAEYKWREFMGIIDIDRKEAGSVLAEELTDPEAAEEEFRKYAVKRHVDLSVLDKPRE